MCTVTNNPFAGRRARQQGFTLLEILIALFIFTILSLILATALRSVIDVQLSTERKAERLGQLQMALLLMSRDIEQAVNRPIASSEAKEEPALRGNAQGFTFTHTGFANPLGKLPRSILSRSAYIWNDDGLWRLTWPVLDLAPDSQSHTRRLLTNVLEAHFEYLDQAGQFHSVWPLDDGQSQQPLPKAIRITLLLKEWGRINQLYVIPAQNDQQASPSPKS